MTSHTLTLKNLKNPSLLRTQSYINGSWISSSCPSPSTFDVLDPATLETLATLPEMTAADVSLAVNAAHTAFHTFKKTSGRERARKLRKWAGLCEENKEDLALILCLENGKTMAEARGEVGYGASFLEWFAGEAERGYGDVVPTANLNQRIVTFKQPVGVAALLAPWNFPIAMITRKCGAALAAGCTTIWKPAGETPLSALAQAVLASQAGFPPGTINVLTSLNTVAEVGEALCKNPKVSKLSFTGSTRVGKLLMQQCSSTLKKLSLELGGNSPFIVFEDADMDVAVESAVMAKFRNSGQTCVTANRVFVQAGIYDAFAQRLTEKIKTLRVGAGTDPDVFIGPLTHSRAVDKALTHISDAKSHGAQVVLGGAAMKEQDVGKGYFLQPTVITGMKEEMLMTREETFAPVVGLYKFETEEEVLRLANDCEVGLGSFVMTGSIARSWRVAEGLEVGMVGINIGLLSACENPFGGVKGSGFGREGGRQGMDEYLVVKSMFINVAN